MSINAMTNAAIARRPDFAPAGPPPRTYEAVAAAAGTPPAPAPQSGAPAEPPPPPSSNGANTAFQTLTTYIPTELVTLYVAAIAALKKPEDHWTSFIPFACFVVAAPLTVWIAFATKLKTAGKPLPLRWSECPKWEMSAGTIAFIAWAFAMPNSPFEFYHLYSKEFAGFLVLVVSAGLGLLSPLFQRPLSAGQT